MAQLVPIEDLPAAVRASVKPGDTTFNAYAQQYEKDLGLKPGLLAGLQYKGEDPLRLLDAAAKDQAQVGARGVSTPQPPAPPPTPAPPMEYNPAMGGGHLQVGPFDTGVQTPQWLEQALAGAGKSLADTGRGIGQMIGMVPQVEVDAAARRDAPLMRTGPGAVGNVGGYVAQTLLPAGVASDIGTAAPKLLGNPYVQDALVNGAMGLAAPVETGGSRLAQGGLGAAAGAAGRMFMEGARSLVGPAWQYAKNGVADLAQKAMDEYGIPLRASDVSPSPVLHGVQAGVDMLPFSGSSDYRAAQQSAFNKRLANTMGEDVDDLAQALRQAKPRLNQTYDDLAARNAAVFDNTAHLQKLDDALQKFRRNDTSVGKAVTQNLEGYLDNMLFDPQNVTVNAQGNLQMPGKLYKEFRSEARQLSQSAANKGDGQLADFYRTVKETLDDAVRTNATPEDAKLYKLTDKQYGNMKTLEAIAPKTAEGDADFTKLASVLTRGGADNIYPRNSFVYGDGDQTLPELARIGTTFMGRGLPPSPWRSFAARAKELGPATVGGGAGALGAVYALNHGDEHPVLGTLGALGGMALGSKALGSALNSEWLTRGFPAGLRALQAAEAAGAQHVPAGVLQAWMDRYPPQEPPAGAER